MKTINVNNTIESYLSGTAGKTEEEWLRNEIQSDPLVAREVNLRRRTNEILADKGVFELRNKLAVIEMQRRSKGSLRKTVARTASYAAAFAMVAIISSLLYMQLRSDSSGSLYSKYYTRYEAPGNARSAVNADNSLMENAIALYNAKDYNKAITYLEQIVSSGSEDMQSVFMHGMANMEIKNYPKASGSFNQVLEQNDNLYIEDAAWYLGLCYLMTDENDKALKQFTDISNSHSRYSKKAARLVRRMK